MDERAQRIVNTAMALAAKDGFAAMRLRDVAAHAQVALGTVYRRFRSKEEILIAAMEVQAERLKLYLSQYPPQGESPQERVESLFAMITDALCSEANLGQALVRSIASGDPHITDRVASFHAMTTIMVMSAMRDVPYDDSAEWGGLQDEDEREVAAILQQVWFASLVGWAGGVHDELRILRQVRTAARRLLG